MSERVIPLAEPCLRGNERAYLHECLRTNWVSSVGPFVERFEREFAASVGSRFAVACSSGTAALHLAMRVLGVGQGDEVVVPTFTFIASANAVTYQGARVTLVDSEPATWNLDPVLVEEEITRRERLGLAMPKAIEVVHILGHPADIEPLVRVADAYEIPIVEDAAESLGATYRGGAFDGRHVGTLGRLGCFSFNGNKIITTGGGGMVVTDDPELARRAKHLTTQARLPGLAYDHDEVGYNYRLSNLAAAMGVAQLEQLPTFLAAKREHAARYDIGFDGISGIHLPPHAPWADRSAWLYSIRADARADASSLLTRLIDGGIGARPVWPPLHRMAPYSGSTVLGSGDLATSIAATAISLPSSVGLDAAEQSRVIDAVRDAVAE